MKKADTKARAREVREPRPEYDFRGGVRGKYARRFAAGSNVVVLDPDLVEAFPDSAAVNAALRTLARTRRTKGRRATRTRK